MRNRTHLQRGSVGDQMVGDQFADGRLLDIGLFDGPLVQVVVSVDHNVDVRAVDDPVAERAWHVRIGQRYRNAQLIGQTVPVRKMDAQQLILYARSLFCIQLLLHAILFYLLDDPI